MTSIITFSSFLSSHLFSEVLVTNILIHFDIIDLFRFRSVSRQTYAIVKRFLQVCLELDFSSIASRIDWYHFEMIVGKSRRLKRLNLTGCKWIVEKKFNQLVLQFTRLEDLNLSFCHKVTNRTLTLIAQNCPRLRQINLRDCHYLDGITLSIIARSCTNLETIDLSNCWNLDDKALIYLFAELANNLTNLSISNLYSISDNSIFALSVHCRCLVQLDISGCWRLTDQSISHLIQLDHLNRIKLDGCSFITLIGHRALVDSGILIIDQ